MAKVIPIGQPQDTRERFIIAVGDVLSRNGYSGLTANAVANSAGVKKELIRHVFGSFNNLVKEYGHSELFWPTAQELLDNREEELKALPPEEQMAWFFKQYLKALRKRPQTVNILAWELRQRDDRQELLEQVRVRTALEFFEHLHEDTPDEVDLTALVVVMAGSIHHLLVRSLLHRHFGGVDFRSERGWLRIIDAIDRFFHGALSEEI